jgi:predicted flap endonuclease-1-like 5' DNA nuclease
MFEEYVEEIVFAVFGLFLGTIIAMFRSRHWQRRIIERDENIENLKAFINEKDESITKLNKLIEEYKDNIEKLNYKIRSNDDQIHYLTSRAVKAEDTASELENSLKERWEGIDILKIDNLTSIKGINQKVSIVLQYSGINTFTQLAEAKPIELEQILKKANLSADPTTWPEQARLAAEGNWKALLELQDSLM